MQSFTPTSQAEWRRDVFLLVFSGFFLAVALVSCGGGGESSSPPPGIPTYTVGGSISGLTSSGLVLANGTDTLTVSSGATSFAMPTALPSGAYYWISVVTQPEGLTCTVSNVSGTMPAANVTSVQVNCSTPYTIGGSISGLTSSGLVLGNGADTLTVASGATIFTMPTARASGAYYWISVVTQPAGLICTVSNGSGTMPAANITNVQVNCSTPYTIGGSISGLSGSGLVLANGGDTHTVLSGATSFTMPTALTSGTAYAIRVATQPTGLHCTVANGSGTMSAANVTSVQVSCQVGWVGTKQLGVAGANTFGYSVATDASGNVYVAGYTTGGLDGNTLTGTQDFFVTKYDILGNKLYTRQLGVAGSATYGSSVATDASGNVYVAGSTRGGLDGNTLSGTNCLSGTLDFFVTKYDNIGNKLYTRQLGGGLCSSTYGNAVTTDTSGNIYVAGSTNYGLDGNTFSGAGDFFVTKYDSLGNKLYTRQLGVGGQPTYGRSVVTDASGNVYVAGYTNGGLDGNTRTGYSDFFVTKYDSIGNKLYTRLLGVAGKYTYGNSVATDASGNVYVAGYTTGGLDGNTLTGTQDFFVTKYDILGNKLYTRQLGVAGTYTYGSSVATDANGNAYVAGYTNGGLDGNTLTGYYDFFVTKYDNPGHKLYTRQLGVTGANTYGYPVATDASGNAYVAGYTNGGLDGNTLTGTADFFVTKYDSNGVKQ